MFTPFKVRDLRFNVTDTIDVIFSPFRGKNLGAIISSLQNSVSLGAAIKATFPLQKVVPSISRLTAVELRVTEDQFIQEVKLQLEGTLREYIYVNGTDDALIRDPTTGDWKINIRSFQPIAAGLFGDHAAARICKLGDLTSFTTIDQAVRSCIQAVIGLDSEVSLAASIQATGQINDLNAQLGISNNFGDLRALASRVFPMDVGASVSSTGGIGSISGFIQTQGTGVTNDLGAFIEDIREGTLSGTITTSGGQPFLPNNLNAFLLQAFVTVSG